MNKPSFSELVQPIIDSFNEAAEQIKLAMSCKMRRFYLIDAEKAIIGAGIVFEDGAVAMRWRVHTSTVILNSVDDFLAIYGHGGKAVIKYIDGIASHQYI